MKLKTYADVAYLRQAGLVQEVDSFYKVGFAERTGEYSSVQVFASREKEKQSNVAVTQSCYIKTRDEEAAAAMERFERFLEYAPNMHLSKNESRHLM